VKLQDRFLTVFVVLQMCPWRCCQ